MKNRSEFLHLACNSIVRGDAADCEENLQLFSESVAASPLSEEEREGCELLLKRLRKLAEASCIGVDSARMWLAELNKATGGFDVYDRGGRRRVKTELSDIARRF